MAEKITANIHGIEHTAEIMYIGQGRYGMNVEGKEAARFTSAGGHHMIVEVMFDGEYERMDTIPETIMAPFAALGEYVRRNF